MPKPLKPLHERFCQEYTIDCNGSAAYARATGRKVSGASRVKACYLLKRPEVRARIAELQKKIGAKVEVTATRVIEEIALIGFDSTERSVDRLKALELLGKHLKLFTDKVEWLGDDSFVKLLEAARGRVKQ